ncbi:expressed unknown protein [Seminavis robusta]|uniref:Uncharacterized protein n=1 Tax=Seminavis robusta TaxID=568900 RepID=A0A9N8EE72_9STRA|nr:expressed unknown protein [Seminavis robusta]|eukprot:Sro994_g229060.1 n/a (93) ;mRNA; r:26306-26584
MDVEESCRFMTEEFCRLEEGVDDRSEPQGHTGKGADELEACEPLDQISRHESTMDKDRDDGDAGVETISKAAQVATETENAHSCSEDPEAQS